tara:strand:+ start:114362 stop:115861 length:1500 start_codon:yes stop_codon:yes gene_type:complete
MSDDKEIRQGILVNVLGMLGQLCGPASLLVAARLYGADRLGVFLAALALLDIAISFLTSGFRDAALMFVARHAGDGDDDGDRDGANEDAQLYQSLSNAIVWSFGCSILVILAAFFLLPLAPARFDAFSPELIPMLQLMVLGVPLFSFGRIVFAATQGLKIMKYEAMDAAGRSLLLFVLALAMWPLTHSGIGLAIAYLASQLMSFGFSVYVFRKHFSPTKLAQSLRSFRLHRTLLKYAIPQNLNMALNHFITQVDVLMLAYLGASAFQVGFYGAAARIVRELRRIRTVFSGALSPHFVVLFKRSKLQELSLLYSKNCSLIAFYAILAILLLAAVHPQLLQLIDPTFIGDTRFVFVLLLLPYLDCSFGLAGNLIAMTGHSRINLFNSTVIGLSNVVLNAFLIPEHGLLGAAAASAVASIVMAFLQIFEAGKLLRVPLRISQLYRPHLAGAIAIAAGWCANRWLLSQQGAPLMLAGIMLLTFALTFVLVGGRLRQPPPPVLS